ncbi:ABC-F family ATP-binding cassette domain-containing protein [Microbacteriaceae bacterium VKM Ac-2854]|nr:ABC-F family ATP-binding cassette domain-containing protein [Microbacteriaceae bacterium VKM Ac-2854]
MTTTTSDHLRAVGVSHGYGGRPVLTAVDLTIAPGRRVGLIGENGAGKSTLLRLLAGVEQPDSGSIVRPRRTGILWQEPPFDPSDTIDAVFERELGEVRAIERALEDAAAGLSDGTAEADARYERALAAAESADVWSVDTRRDALVAGLGVAAIDPRRSLGEISGGQRSRVALAALLLGRPEALLLDEPTNHLDDDAVALLTAQLRDWRGPVLFASHDRAFLDEVATGLIDLDPAASGSGVTVFGAGDGGRVYTASLEAKAAERRRWQLRHREEELELEQLERSVAVTAREVGHGKAMADRNKMSYGNIGNRVQGQLSRRVRNARGRLSELSASRVGAPPELLRFAGLPHGFGAQSGDEPLLQLSDVRVGSRLVVDTLQVEPDERMLVTGPNGAGKSTLLTVLAGALRADAGSIRRRPGTRIGLLEQDVVFADPQSTPRRRYERTLGERRAEAVPLDSLGLIAPRDLDRPIGALSVGQRRRLALALVIARPPHLFLLDEPSNHLSLALATELEEALGGYPGAVIVASHDRWTRARWTGSTLAVADGRIERSPAGN